MRDETEVRSRLAMELMAQTQHPHHESHGARAIDERVKVLLWVLEPSESELPPGGNGMDA